jgi:WASH complex subunit 7, N-terminal
MRLVDWIVKLNSDMLRSGPRGDESEFLERLANMIVVGINLAVQIKRTVKTLMLMHDATGTSLNPERLKDILQAIEMLKAIEIEFKTKKFMINQWVVLMNRNLGDKITDLLHGAKQNVVKKKFKEPLSTWVPYLMNTVT